MEAFIFILSVAALIIGIFLFKNGIEYEKFFIQLLGFILITASLILMIAAVYFNYVSKSEITPQAIDVYRGKTTLQIKYQDSIPIDSIVVFKNGIK